VKYIPDFDALLRGYDVRYFTARELCPVGRLAGGVVLKAPPCGIWGNILPTVRILDELRAFYGKPVIVNSGYRDAAYNRAVGSTPGSMHTQFRALDFSIAAIQPRSLYEWLDRHREADRIGLGLYPTFVHLDTRGHRARW
jgi:hypothetical protein